MVGADEVLHELLQLVPVHLECLRDGQSHHLYTRCSQGHHGHSRRDHVRARCPDDLAAVKAGMETGKAAGPRPWLPDALHCGTLTKTKLSLLCHP